MFVRMVNSCLIITMKQISLFYAENVLKMRKMGKSANYADPHHRILSDALAIGQKVMGRRLEGGGGGDKPGCRQPILLSNAVVKIVLCKLCFWLESY